MRRNYAQVSTLHSHRTGRQLQGFRGVQFGQDMVEAAYRELSTYGIHIDRRWIAAAMDGLELTPGGNAGFGMDDLGDLTFGLSNLTSGGITTPVQFLQAWLPGFVMIMTKALRIDELVGISTVGQWRDAEVVQGVAELQGYAVPYTDRGNVPLMTYNTEFERRSIIQWEAGFQVDVLEEDRAAAMRVNAAANKRKACAKVLKIARNRVGFVGYDDGQSRTFGYLNDPNLPAYVTSPQNAAGTSSQWKDKTFQEITADIRMLAGNLMTQSGGNIDPFKEQTTLAVALDVGIYLTNTTNLGWPVMKWIDDTFKGNMRLITVPELSEAVGGQNVVYLHAERVDDADSDDDGGVFSQLVPAEFVALGVEKKAKGYLEDFTNATAGVMCKRPWAVTRMVGV